MDLFSTPTTPADPQERFELFFHDKMERERKEGWFKPEYECYYNKIYQDYLNNINTGVSKSLWVCWYNAYKFIYEI